jgi:molecular chaperone Hsp33
LAGSIRHEELVDPELSLETMIWRLFHEEHEVRVDPLARISRGCRCSYEHYRDVLSRFPDSEREDMRDDDGLISVDCAFCSKIFTIDL